MKRSVRLIVMLSAGIAALALISCKNDLVEATKQRVTFDVVFEPQTRIGKTVYADIIENTGTGGGTTIETVSGTIKDLPNSTHSDVELTTTQEVPTNVGYFIDFYIDMNGNGSKDTGDLEGEVYAEVRAGFDWIEVHCFESDLSTVS